MDRRWQWAGLVMFILGAIASAADFILSRAYSDEIADARLTGAVLTAGLAFLGAILAITAYLSNRDKPEERTRPSAEELGALILVVFGINGITNTVGRWYATSDLTQGWMIIVVSLIFMAVGAQRLRRSEQEKEAGV